jgi:hypothetical protein
VQGDPFDFGDLMAANQDGAALAGQAHRQQRRGRVDTPERMVTEAK